MLWSVALKHFCITALMRNERVPARVVGGRQTDTEARTLGTEALQNDTLCEGFLLTLFSVLFQENKNKNTSFNPLN